MVPKWMLLFIARGLSVQPSLKDLDKPITFSKDNQITSKERKQTTSRETASRVTMPNRLLIKFEKSYDPGCQNAPQTVSLCPPVKSGIKAIKLFQS